MKTAKELRGEHGRASLSTTRLKYEITRKYQKDPIGLKLCLSWMSDIEILLDDIEKPLELAQDFDDACDLRGIARFGLDTVNRALSVLLPLKDKLEGTKTHLTVIKPERQVR